VQTASIPVVKSEPIPAPPRADPPAPAQARPAPGAVQGVGQGTLGTLPASNHPNASAMASAEPWPRPQAARAAADFPAPAPSPVASALPASAPSKPVMRSGWFIQVGAFDDINEARHRLDEARGHARDILGKADPFTEPVAKGDKTLYRARFAGFEKDQAEAACRALKRSAISCITVKN
jgi:D-alanyl-D-alanine carboxypeptidase